MRIISWNINGLKNRFNEVKNLIEAYDPDIVCLQKVRCNTGRERFTIDGYDTLYSAIDSGKWSGVITYVKISSEKNAASDSRNEFLRVDTTWLSDNGHLQVFRCNSFALLNTYVPFANTSLNGAVEHRMEWDNRFRQFVKNLARETPVVICGDLNVILSDKDTCELHYDQNKPCFTAWERNNLQQLLTEANLVDAFREINPDKIIPTFYGNFRHTGIGNRIDYFLISRHILNSEIRSEILTDFGTGQSVPIVLDFDPTSQYAKETQASAIECIPVREAAHWLATMAATKGLISPSERKLLKDFATKFNIEPKSLFRMAYAIANRVDIPEVKFVSQLEIKGRLFEEFVVKLTADKARFTRLNWSSDKYVDGLYSLDTLMPDLHLRHKLDNGEVEYYIECKYRSSLHNGELDLSSQLWRYLRMINTDKPCKLFIAAGIGGTPSVPEKFYVIPSDIIAKDGIIHIEDVSEYICHPTPEGLHNLINRHFNRTHRHHAPL